ncbi:MAG: DUF285 domain-containing protein [Candidatus Saccharibacteria bacterium]|nr:DUF285 domain-containing protein [Candidatus Saccharibacteria bacterium]
MSKQTFKIGKSFIPNILVFSCSSLLLLFGALIIASPVADNSKAVVVPDVTDGLSLVTSQTIEATIRPEDEGTLSIIKDTIVGATNSQYGYEVYISTNSDTINDIHLNGDPEKDQSTQKILATAGTYDAPVALDLTNGATWGFAIAGQDNFDANYNTYTPAATSKFAAVPTITDKQLIHSNPTSASDDSLDIYYGINADSSLEPGMYKTEILYTALPIPSPYVAQAIVRDNGSLDFLYERDIYEVGDSFTDSLGVTAEITNAYVVPITTSNKASVPWLADSTVAQSIISVNFEDSFNSFKPQTTKYWFADLEYVEVFTNIEKINLSETTSTSYMFYSLGDNTTTIDFGNLKLLDMSNVTDPSYMFSCAAEHAQTINLDLDNWNLANASNLSNMFDDFAMYSPNITMSLKNWNVPNVASLYHTFWNVGYMLNVTTPNRTFSMDVSGWTLGNLRTAEEAFFYTGAGANTFSLVGLSDWDVSTLAVAKGMFLCTGMWVDDFYLQIEDWSLTSGGTLENMFYEIGAYANTWEMDLSGWTFGSGIGKVNGMFDDAGQNSTTWELDASDWTFNNAVLTQMFNDTGNNVANTWVLNATNWTFAANNTILIDFLKNAGMGANSWTIVGASTWDVSKVLVFQNTFFYAGYHAQTWSIGDIGGWDVSHASTMDSMFAYAGFEAGSNFTIGDLSGWNVQNLSSHNDFIIEDSTNPHGVIEPIWQ